MSSSFEDNSMTARDLFWMTIRGFLQSTMEWTFAAKNIEPKAATPLAPAEIRRRFVLAVVVGTNAALPLALPSS